MNSRLESLWSNFCDPATFAALLEPVAVWGPLFGFLFFLTSWVCKEPKSQKAALAFTALASLSVFVAPAEGGGLSVAAPGEAAARVLPGSFAWLYLVLAGLAALTLFLGRGGRAGLWLTLLTLVACLVTSVVGFELLTGTGTEPEPGAGAAPEADPLPGVPRADGGTG